MSIDQHVSVTIRVNNAGIARQGFGTIGVLTYKNVFPERSRSFRRLADVIALGFAADSPEAIAVGRILGQSPHPPSVKLLRGDLPPTLAYRIDVIDVEVGKTYALNVEGEGVTETEVSYTPKADITFADGDVSVGDDTIDAPDHGEVTGAGPYRLSNAGGALPTGVGIAVDTNVWLIVDDEDTIRLATSKANALANVDIDITAAAGGGVHTLRRAQNDVIVAQLVQGLNAVVGKNFTAAQVVGAGETDYATVTADEAGGWFAIERLNGTEDNLKLTMTHVDPGVATDLSNILLVDKDWYYLHTLFNSEQYVLAAAEWVEAQSFKAYAVDVVDSDSENLAAGGGDVLQELESLGYKRTLYSFKRDPAQMFSAGLMGRLAPLNVGSWTAAYKTITGCTADSFTSTQIDNLDAKKASYYKEEAGVAFSWEGKVAHPDYLFFDVTVALDFVLDGLQKAIFAVKKALDKVAYTDEDIAKIRGAAEGWIDVCKSDKHKIVALGTPGDPDDPEPSVSWPRVADIDPSARALRELPDGSISFRLQGAVHKTSVDVSVTF